MVFIPANNESISGRTKSKPPGPTMHQQIFDSLTNSKWLPVIKEFQDLIETDDIIYHGFTQMFQQASSLPGVSCASDYKEMLQSINDAVQKAPQYERSEYANCSIYRVLDKVMCTPTGLATLANPLVNAQFRRIFDVWASFLSSSESRSVLTADESGWFGPMARADMPTFFDTFLCDQDASYCGFQSWDDYFTRSLRPGARPVEHLQDNSVINSACESTVYCIANNIKERDGFWLKGQPYSLQDMFHDDPFTKHFVGGTIFQCYLRPIYYHRWHSPVNGRVVKIRVIPGVYFSQAPQAPSVNGPQMNPFNSQRFLTAVSTRTLIFIESDNPHIGLMCFMAVGIVSACDTRVKPGSRVTKGQEMGIFHFGGSTYCMLFRPSTKIRFDCAVGDSVLVNSSIANV
ncbi:unnamed protein product [Rhizoctonia solani]|uniref:L-tryptophan decarboxylase PsiD-like domain-containing protein n=1 Tax=Rhizoctonia solani TaxID=456999 RepID=A0A8H3DMM0_9AGAM|nr:unnamed protein product [Rhizoctonia solani]